MKNQINEIFENAASPTYTITEKDIQVIQNVISEIDHGKLRGRFQRIFAGEKSADEELALAGNRTLRADGAAHFFKIREQRLFDVEVARGEVSLHRLQFGSDSLVAQRERAADDVAHAFRRRWNERADEDACTVGLEHCPVASESDGRHVCKGSAMGYSA